MSNYSHATDLTTSFVIFSQWGVGIFQDILVFLLFFKNHIQSFFALKMFFPKEPEQKVNLFLWKKEHIKAEIVIFV